MPFVNLYRSGWYHRAGKPNTYDAHPGDLYPTEEQAKADIAPEARDLYIGTFAVLVSGNARAHLRDYGVELNGPESAPVPLSETRNAIRQARLATPLTEVMREGVGLAKAYKPTHGGYPG